MGGYVSTEVSTVDQITFPFDSGTGSGSSYMSVAFRNQGGANSTNHGFSFGGYSGSALSYINRIQFPFSSGTSSVIGNLNSSTRSLAAIDGVDFVSQFANWGTN